MSEAPEHSFLSNTFLEVLDKFSSLSLYGYTEVERKKFDFACDIQRDWKRVLVGQTLWKHQEGLDKDLRMLLTQSDVDILAYVVRHNTKNIKLLQEAIQDYQNTPYASQLFKLKVFWVPSQFNADNEDERNIIREELKSRITTDLLFNVLFGNLSSKDIRFFLERSGSVGIAILYFLANNVLYFSLSEKKGSHQLQSVSQLAKRLGLSRNVVDKNILALLGCGLLNYTGIADKDSGPYFVPLKGRIFLELCNLIDLALEGNNLNLELYYILGHLKIEPKGLTNLRQFAADLSLINYSTSNVAQFVLPNLEPWLKLKNPQWDKHEEASFLATSSISNAFHWPEQIAFTNLLRVIEEAKKNWKINIKHANYKVHSWEKDPRYPWEKDKTYFLRSTTISSEAKKLVGLLKRKLKSADIRETSIIITESYEILIDVRMKVVPVTLISKEGEREVHEPGWEIDILVGRKREENGHKITEIGFENYDAFETIEETVDVCIDLLTSWSNT